MICQASDLLSQCRFCMALLCPVHASATGHSCPAWKALHPSSDPLARYSQRESKKRAMRLVAVPLLLMVVGLAIVTPLAFGTSPVRVSDVANAGSSLMNVFYEGVASTEAVLGYHTTSGQVGPTWVSDFMSIVNQHRTPSLVRCPILDSFAENRFHTQTSGSSWTVSSFGFAADANASLPSGLAEGVDEQVLFPVGYSPDGFYNHETFLSPQGDSLLGSGYSFYGYFVGEGPALTVNGLCTAPTPPSAQNLTQYYSTYGCSPTVQSTTWVVVELATSCPA